MKLAIKLAGVFATGAFLLVSLTTYVGSLDVASLIMGKSQNLSAIMDISMAKPLRVLTLAIPSTILAAILGYILGNTFDHPKGSPKKKTRTSPLDEMLEKEGLTGEETFLDDLNQPSASAPPAQEPPPEAIDPELL